MIQFAKVPKENKPAPVHVDYELHWPCKIRVCLVETDYHGEPGSRYMLSVDRYIHGEDKSAMIAQLADELAEASRLLREANI